jgi:hypothetical protein
MITRYRAGRSLVISMIARALSFSGMVPHDLASVSSFLFSAVPLPAPPRIPLSGAGPFDLIVPPPS